MRIDILMPKMGMTMTTGIITEWKKENGAAVVKDEPIADIETDKITNQVCAPDSGILNIIAQDGDELPVAGIMGYIETDA